MTSTAATALKLIFLCTHNACRSIVSEAIFQQRGDGLVLAASAGSAPSGVVHPLTLRHLASRGYDPDGLFSKSLDEASDFAPDAVITVCDEAAEAACPVWLDTTPRVHWPLPDPTRLADPALIDAEFVAVFKTLESRLQRLLAHLHHGRGADEVLDCLHLLNSET